MDDDQQAAFLSSDLDTSTRTDLYDAWERSDDVTASDVGDAADTYKSLDDTAQSNFQTLLEGGDSGAVKLASETDTDTFEDALVPGCLATSAGSTAAMSTGGVSVGGGTTQQVAPALNTQAATAALATESGCSVSHTDYLTEIRDVNDEVDEFDAQQFFQKADDLQDKQAFKKQIVDGDIPMQTLAKNHKELKDIKQTSVGDTRMTTIEVTRETNGGTVTGELVYPDDTDDTFGAAAKQSYGDADAEEYVDADTPADSWDDLSDSGDRAAFVEEKLTPYYLEQKAGMEILCVDTGCGDGANGIDVIAWDPDANGGDGKLVIVESKWTTDTKAASNTKLGDAREGTPESDIQMTTGWIDDAWQTGKDNNNINLDGSIKNKEEIIESARINSDTANALQKAVSEKIEKREYDRAYFYASDSQNGKTITSKASRGYYADDLFDRVYHFKAGGVTNDG